MQFNHDNQDVHLFYKNKKITINSGSYTEMQLTDEELLNYSSAILKYNQSIGRISSDELQPDDLKISKAKSLNDINSSVPFYKYISQGDYEKYYSQGSFQLGTSKYYREIEKKQSRDGFEGFNISVLQINDIQIPISLFHCNNYLIFCGTSNNSNDYMQHKFGQIEMEITNTGSFASDMAISLGALNYTISFVEYTNAKVVKSDKIQVTNLKENEIMQNEDVLDLLLTTSLYPSLYVKPNMFSPEQELRIVFEMPNNFEGPHHFYDKTLLSHIKFNNL